MLWREQSGRLWVRAESDALGRPASSAEVWDSLPRSDGPRAALPHLRFSRKAAPVQLHVQGSTPLDLSTHVAVRASGRLIPLGEGQDQVIADDTWFSVEASSAQELLDSCHRLGIQTRGRIGLGDLHRVLCSEDLAPFLVDETRLQQADPLSWVPMVPDPQGITAKLYPYQRTGSAYIRALAAADVGCLVADEMGLGKTLQVISLLADRRGRGTCLVVAPASLLVNWQREFSTFAPHLKIHTHRGRWRAGVASAFSGSDVVITSYDTLVTDIAMMRDLSWDVAVLDEAQTIKNPDAQRSKAVKSLSRRVGLAVTGTPVENRLTDVWSISEFVVPQLLGSRASFEALAEGSEDAASLVGRIINPITLRRRVADVADDLPPLVQVPIGLEFTTSERTAYLELSHCSEGLNLLTRQRMYCAHADDSVTAEEFLRSTKVRHLLDQLEEVRLREEKALVFASFQATLDRLAVAIRGQALMNVKVIDGRSMPAQRQEYIDDFESATGAAALVLNPRAAGVGLNITAANHVFHFNPEWNPGLTDQATARAYRRRQHRTVFVHHLYYDHSIEQRAVAGAEKKREMLETVSREAE